MSSKSNGWPRSLARLRSRPRTEAPILRFGSGIGRHRIKIGLHDFPNSGFGRIFGDLGGRRLALAQRLAETFKRDIEAGAGFIALSGTLAVAEKIDDGLGGIIYAYRHAFDLMVFKAFAKKFAAEADDLQRRLRDHRAPIFRADRHPYGVRDGVGQFMISERRDEADDAFRHTLRGFGKNVMRVQGGIRQLIEAASELMDESIVAHAGDSRARDAFLRELGNPGDAPAFEQRRGRVLAEFGFLKPWREYDTNPRICQDYILGLVSS